MFGLRSVSKIPYLEEHRHTPGTFADHEVGLSGSIWTENGSRALRVARRMETGVISVRVATPSAASSNPASDASSARTPSTTTRR
jgi:hypothetical protein